MRRDGKSGGDPSASSTMLVGLIGAIALVVIIAGLSALYYGSAREEWEGKFLARSAAELTDVRAAQQAELEGYRWVDREQGVVAIPIERAMELVARELEREDPAPEDGP
jgi:hypothetical protein